MSKAATYAHLKGIWLHIYLTPSQEFVFLGIHFQMVVYICRPSTDREAAIDTLASRQEFKLSFCEAVDEARRHTDVDGLSGAIALETDTTQFLRLLEQEKRSLSQLILLLQNDWLVLSWWSRQSHMMVAQTLVP